MKKKIAILGSTGSIGTQALEVIEQQEERFQIEVLTANKNADLLMAMLPEGSTTSGTATGVPKTLLNEFYTKGERAKMAKTGTKAGLAVQTKKPNINRKEFLEVENPSDND